MSHLTRIPEYEWRMRAFIDWWFHQLAGSLPMALTRATDVRPDAVILEIDGESIRVLVRQDGAMTFAERLSADDAAIGELPGVIGRLQKRPERLMIRVPRAQVLEKRLSLSVAVQRDLTNALGFEIERETPFALDEVYWTHALRHRDAAAGSLDVDLILLPRASVDPFVNAIRDAGLNPSGVEVDLESGDAAFISLGTEKRSDWSRSQRSLVPLAAAACALAVVAGLTPFVVQQWAIASADATIAALSTTARDAAALRQSTDRLAATAAFLNKERAQNGGALVTLAALTRALPDDSYLTAVSLRAGRLTLSGMSPSAAEIIGQLAQSKDFREPSFDAPVTQSEQSDLETFTISVSIAPTGSP